MPAKTLLDLNSDELFQNHTIAEIKVVELEIRNEIEKKKEELRTMVGEKCRDLLNAADTITEMKETAENFMAVINHTKQLCQVLKEEGNIRHDPLPVKLPKRLSKSTEEISKVVEIRIMLALPEQIWTTLDCKDYLLGAQLFLFATNLNLGLEVCSSSENIAYKYPVLKKQWEVIASCKKTIIQRVFKELEDIKTSVKKAAECLCSLVFLEVWSYEKLLNQFLEIRTLALYNIFKSEELSRKKLRQCVELVQQTLVIIFVCFLDMDDKKSSIQMLLDSVTGHEGKPTLSKIIQISSLPEEYLSPLIINFRPKTSNELVMLSPEHIKKAASDWLQRLEEPLRVELTKILLLIDDIKRLHKIIKQEVLEVKYPSNWEEITYSLLSINNLNIYNKFIKGHVTSRIRELIQITWHHSLNNVLACLSQVDEDVLKDRGKYPEKDMRFFIWKESTLDNDGSLRLQTLGYTPYVNDLCQKMDLFLSQLLNDVVLYIGQDSTTKSKLDEDNDAKIILSFLSSYSLEMIQRFTHQIVESCKNEGVSEAKITIRARFLNALTSQSSGLEKCLNFRLQFEEDVDKDGADSIFQQAITCLNEGSHEMWKIWRVMMSSKLQILIKNKLGLSISVGNLLKSKLLSEVITIEEQTEDGTNVNSDLRVPSQPSLFLQELLFQICQELNGVAPHTLPREIHQDLVDSFVKDILEHYQDWSKSDIIYQSQAWQMLLDVRFITLLLVTKENKQLSQIICETLEKSIDPFDLDVYFPHMQNSVKRSTQKLQGTFGVLVNFSEKLALFNGLKLSPASAVSKLEEPNLLATSGSVPWFPSLPVTNFGARKQESSNLDGSNVFSFKEFSKETTGLRGKERENKKDSVTSDFFKSAGAFFDAMTGGWT